MSKRFGSVALLGIATLAAEAAAPLDAWCRLMMSREAAAENHGREKRSVASHRPKTKPSQGSGACRGYTKLCIYRSR